MSTIDKSQSPYYDDYNPSKNYSQMMAVPGRVEQARDYTQMQTMVYDFLQRLSDTLLKNGAIVSGMGFTFSNSGTIIVDDGKVYMDGKIHNFFKQEIPVTKVGSEIIGVKLQESIVTETQDTSLLDPTTSTGNFGQPGTHRIQTTIVLVLNDPDASPIYEFQDGDLQSEVPRPQFDGLQDMLAKRTYDESGNFIVSGLTTTASPKDAHNVQAVVEAGTAYVKGYQVIKPTPTKLTLPMATDYRTVNAEPKFYATGTTTYQLNNVPARAIDRVTAYVQVTQTITRSSTPGGKDPLGNTPVVNIISVTQGATTYVNGTDYTLTSDSVDWSPAGAEPTSGTAYTVVYQFNKTMIQGTDYQKYSVVGDYGQTTDYVQFLSGDTPANNSTFYVDYDFYLARVDLITIDQDGTIAVTAGQSDIQSNVKPPTAISGDLLPLATVYLPPNSGGAQATFNSTNRLSMSQLQDMLRRVQDLEFNQAITALDQEAISGEVPTDLRGVFSDSFRSTTRGDITYSGFNVMYDLDTGTIRLPIQTSVVNKPNISGTTAVKQFSTVATAPMTESVAVSQPYATTSMQINPYLSFNALAVLNMTPAKDSWIDDSFISVNNTAFQAQNFYRWWRHSDKPGYKAAVSNLFNDQMLTSTGSVANWRPAYGDTGVAVSVSSSSSEIDTAVTYMRQIPVTITCTNLVPSADNLTLYFDDIKCSLTPLSPSTAGSTSGTIKANSAGVASGVFTIPANVKTGTREVRLENSNNSAVSSFTSVGTQRAVTETITTTFITLKAVDPLAQTFQFDQPTTLTSVGVYFSGSDNTNNVVCQIRNVVNGFPGSTIYAQKVLTPSQILVSNQAVTETKITFDDPVVCDAGTSYCMVFETDSALTSLYCAELGGTDLTTGTKILRQPYTAGILLSSANAITWTAHQSMYMKFNLYKATFSSNTTIDFTAITGLSADTLVLMGDYDVPSGCTLAWSVSVDNGAYIPIVPEEDTDLIKVGGKVQLRAVMTTNGAQSPMISTDNISVISFTTALSGSYIGRNVELAEAATTITQVYDAQIPSGCTVVPQFSYDQGSTWITPTQTGTESISADFTRYTCQATIPGSANAVNYRARLNITSNDHTLRPKARRFVNIMK